MRHDFDPAETDPYAFYKLLNSVIVPRPIAWVSSTSADGVDNLAPHSFFTVSCVSPPVVQFTSVGRKDSLRNVEATGEFVVCFTPEELWEQVNATGTNFPPGVSEWDAVGLEREPSLRVAPPRVAASPVALECALHSTLCLGNSTVVFGRVVHVAVSGDVMEDGRPEVRRLKPLSRMGANEWGTHGEIREITRIPHEEWPGHYGG
ncbi:MAG: flavin reductase [Solirubrobacterales bacterium]|nr:flavin reductase [Solirubrobacterales bacterium]